LIIELPNTVVEFDAGSIKQYRMNFFHFSNNNLAIRKECARDLGMYDLKARKSEDVDICFRIARDPDWVALREKGSTLRHKARRSLWGLLRQIWGWGFHVGYPYSKTGIRGVYLYWIDARDCRIARGFETDRFPFLVCVYFTDFLLAHLLLVPAAGALLAGHPLWGLTLGAPGLIFLWRFSAEARRAATGFWKKAALSLVHYLVNVTYMTAAVAGGLRHRVLLVPASIFRPRAPSHETPPDDCREDGEIS
jgi:hypothetical protein